MVYGSLNYGKKNKRHGANCRLIDQLKRAVKTVAKMKSSGVYSLVLKECFAHRAKHKVRLQTWAGPT